MLAEEHGCEDVKGSRDRLHNAITVRFLVDMERPHYGVLSDMAFG